MRYHSTGSLDPTGAARDEVYAVDLIAWGGNWRNVGVIGYQIGRKKGEKKNNLVKHGSTSHKSGLPNRFWRSTIPPVFICEICKNLKDGRDLLQRLIDVRRGTVPSAFRPYSCTFSVYRCRRNGAGPYFSRGTTSSTLRMLVVVSFETFDAAL